MKKSCCVKSLCVILCAIMLVMPITVNAYSITEYNSGVIAEREGMLTRADPKHKYTAEIFLWFRLGESLPCGHKGWVNVVSDPDLFPLYHYTNLRVYSSQYDKDMNQNYDESGRIWGTGQVWAFVECIWTLYQRIFYGF